MTGKAFEHDVETNELISRDLTIEEIRIIEEANKDYEARRAFLDSIEEKRLAAEAKLAAIGLTPDDLKALGLG